MRRGQFHLTGAERMMTLGNMSFLPHPPIHVRLLDLSELTKPTYDMMVELIGFVQEYTKWEVEKTKRIMYNSNS